eukprot:9537573-Ditylum_brightwellii.AAC.1
MDWFNCKEVASPGFIIDLHPKITRKDDLVAYLSMDLENVKMEKEKNIMDWMDEYYPDWDDDDTLSIPKFTIQTNSRKFGSGVGRVKTTVLAIEGAQEDA